ncbi:MAG: cyclic nucleotide-binding domain-containing protein [Candidatus Latescibacteria bacterium]|jgi:CRP-like cAMP-binding protein|nr:cyclic nucleotide-binding domain-containing protein [Candidatus Latescibacterota bacterium]
MAEEMDEVQLVRVLLDIPLFEDLDYTQISGLIEACDRLEPAAGEALCEPRTIDDRLLIFLSGKLRLEAADGQDLGVYTEPRVMGEMGVFTGQTRSSRVVSEEPSQLLALGSEALQDLLEEDPQMGNHMLANLIKLLYTRMYDTNEELGALRDEVARLRARLAELAPDDPILSEYDIEEDAEPES